MVLNFLSFENLESFFVNNKQDAEQRQYNPKHNNYQSVKIIDLHHTYIRFLTS